MKPLVVMALESESQGKVEGTGLEVLYTGVGKVNASYALTKRLAQGERPSLVVNLGSAGSPSFATGEVVSAHRFVQRDMDATGLGFAMGQTPFDDTPLMLECTCVFTQYKHGICGSGDSFLQGASPVPCDIIDMEAFALARVCLREDVPFACVKYITDGADERAHNDWQENLRHAAQEFVTLCNTLVA